MKTKKTSTILLSIAAGIIFIVMIAAAEQYYRLMVSNITSTDGESHLIYIPENTNQDSLISIIDKDFDFGSITVFKFHCKLFKWENIKSGAYTIGGKEGDKAVILRLRNAEQTPVKVTINNVRTKGQLARSVASQLMLDSADIASRLDSLPYISRYGFNMETAVCLFIPDTYEMFWNINPDRFFERMAHEYKHFWNESRLRKAANEGLTPVEVAVVASIVEGETNKEFEKPIIAALYLNRLRKGMKLQSDPTVLFALQDFSIRRVLNSHLKYDSPYNTYLYAGLPPGPIRIPRPSTMDAVLNHESNNYLYMCANADFSQTHKFAATYSEHMRNAREYQRELNKRGIK